MKKDLSLQYISGFFDGEGCIGLYKRKDSNATTIRIQLTQNKSKESLYILNYLKTKYGGNITTQKTLSGKTKYNWQLNAKGIKIFLTDIFPYLLLKKSQAKLGLYWLKNRPKIKRDGHGRVLNFSKNEVEFIHKTVKIMKELKG